MTVQPKYHWQFTERESNTAKDSLHELKGQLHRSSWKEHGRIGQAIQLDASDSHINFGEVLGKFGTNDFTVAFGIKILNVHNQDDADLIGNRNVKGHGNWFSLRIESKGKVLTFEVDENSKGKNHVFAKTKTLSSLPNKKWHHIAIVREGKTLKIYFNGAMVAEGTSKTGVANINSSVDVKLGHHIRHTPAAQYEDFRIYHTALNEQEIKQLITPHNRPLKAGEIELVGSDDTSILLSHNVDDLLRFSSKFQTLRVGQNTGVTLYQKSDFEGTAQKCHTSLPDILQTRLKAHPGSVRIWSTLKEPFTGKWVIQALNGHFLSLGKSVLTTSKLRTSTELFGFYHHVDDARLQIIPGADHESTSFNISPKLDMTPLFVDVSESRSDEFALTNYGNDQWLELKSDNTFSWTHLKSDRALFLRAEKFAKNEGQVGELQPGEVALYEHNAYHGKTWILSNRTSGDYAHLTDFQELNDQISSIRMGPDTGVTLFRNFDFHVSDGNGETEIEDIIDHVPALADSQVGNDTISSIKIFRTIDPGEIFTSYTSKLSQDYRMIGDKLEEFSAYRTILRLEPDAGEVEVSATDLTTIEVDGENYEIDEQRSVTLKPNAMNRLMLTSEADGMETPGLKFRTQSMAPNERVVIFPNQEVHQQIAALEDDALWNATDTQGNLIVDHKAHSQEEVASVQNTIKRMMGTVTYVDNHSVVGDRNVTNPQSPPVRSSNRSVSGATIENHPWKLNLGGNNASTQVRALKSGESLVQAKSLSSSVAKTVITETEISQDEFTRLLSQSSRSEKVAPPVSKKGFGTTNLIASRGLIGSIGRGIKKAFKKAKSAVIGVAKGAIHLLLETAEGVIDFVIDTVKKVVEVVEAVVETVVKVVKKFIEFLQFLFNWDDILDTQKYLVQAINDGFDYTAQQIDALKGPVSNFMDDLQETVEEAMNQLITTLGGDPSEVKEADSQLPEAVEWFLSKLLGGSQKDDADPTPRLQTQPTGDSKVENFLFHFHEAFIEGSGAILRGFEGLGETITTLITNPLKPQLAVIVLVETLRDVVIQLLEAIENLALGFLDAIAEAVEQLKKMLNAEIKIPFISDLFRLIGAGKLTPLNLTGLLLAIPVTVVSKLVFGETPFKNEPPLDLSTQIDAVEVPKASLRVTNAVGENAIAQAVIEPRASIQTIDTVARKKSIQHWGNTGLLADVLNGMIAAVLDVVPEGAPDKPNEKTAGFGLEIVSLILGGFSWLASFPSSPNFSGGRPITCWPTKSPNPRMSKSTGSLYCGAGERQCIGSMSSS